MDEAARARLAAWLSAAAGAPVVVTGMALLSRRRGPGELGAGRWTPARRAAALGAAAPTMPRRSPSRAAPRRRSSRCCAPRMPPASRCRSRCSAAPRARSPARRSSSCGGWRASPPATGWSGAPRRRRTALAEALGRELARIHASARRAPIWPSSASRRPTRTAPSSPRSAPRWMPPARRGRCWNGGCAGWSARAPPAGEIVLIHNDFRTGNYMVDGGRVSAILDWEFAGWGDPMPILAGSARLAGASARCRGGRRHRPARGLLRGLRGSERPRRASMTRVL